MKPKKVVASFVGGQLLPAWVGSRLAPFLLKSWPFLVGPFLMSAVLTQTTDASWATFGGKLGGSIALEMPCVLLYLNRKQWLPFMPVNLLFVAWLLISVAYFWLLALLPETVDRSMLNNLAIITLGIGSLLKFSEWLVGKRSVKPWWKKVSFDQAIVLTLFLWALLLAVMATSSLHNPAYHTAEKLLIGMEFEPQKLITHFPFLLSILLQLFACYLIGFSFYYMNHHVLVKRLLLSKGVVHYGLGVLLVILVFTPLAVELINALPINQLFGRVIRPAPFHPENYLGAAAIMLFTSPVIMAIRWFKQSQQLDQLEKANVANELTLLKEQINPHFFFNTLNNLYSLSLTKSAQTPEVILQLSEMMRYVIYRGKEETVRLEEEIKYLEDYIQLHQIRSVKTLDYRFEKHLSVTGLQIPPLLFILFVENAFKHGIEPAEKECLLHLSIKADDRSVRFSCLNSIEEGEAASGGGLGLKNLQKRLNLLFPAKHTLTLEKTANRYKAELLLLL